MNEFFYPYNIHDKVLVNGTEVPELDGQTGTVIGYFSLCDEGEEDDDNVFAIIYFDEQSKELNPAGCIKLAHLRGVVTN